jgi:tetratricopeptide (TPR) repeat protein
MDLIDFVGASRIPLVGREGFLQEIEQCLRRGGSHLFYLEGEGGIGKTVLLEAALEFTRRGRDDGELFIDCIAREVVDLYHADVHTIEGMIRKIVQVTHEEAFGETSALFQALDQARSVGDMDRVNQQSVELQPVFLSEFGMLGKQGVVLALDTLEVLEHERDSFQEALGTEVPILSAGEWLIRSFLPALRGHVLILLAGRPTVLGQRFQALDEQLPSTQVRRIELGALQPAESRTYLENIAGFEIKRDDTDAAVRLLDFARERAGVVHFLTGGRPILLALVADMVAHGWTLPPSFGRTVEELLQRGAEDCRAEVEWALVVRIQESPTPVGETIRTLAWLRKGATPELLARVMDLQREDGQWDAEAGAEYLRQVARLTFIKIRPGEGRIFLHDEMYALLEKYVLQESSQEERDRVYEAILGYYQERIHDLEQRIADSTPASPLLHAQLRQLYVEEMHYRLGHRPHLGFAMYFWLAEQALAGTDAEMDMLLRTELLRTVSWLGQEGALSGLDPEEISLDGAVRWGIRAMFLGNDPQQAMDILARVRDRWARASESLDLAWSHLQLYRAVACILRAEEGDWQQARELLRRVEKKADEGLQDPSVMATARGLLSRFKGHQPSLEGAMLEARRWRARMLKASALNYHGYLDRQQGRYIEAVEHYQASAMLQRRLDLADLAPVLINLSYAMVLTGKFRHARLLTEEAEGWARQSGNNVLLARTLNARALVEVYDNHPRDALRYTDRALEVLRGLYGSRMRGLVYLTRARAHRYLFVSAVEESGGRAPEALDEALKEANQAVNLLKNNPPDRVAALIERGCMYREIGRGYFLMRAGPKAVQAVRQSEEDLNRAATLASAMDLADQEALAWTNLGWLWYYAGQVDNAQEALQAARACVPGDYFYPGSEPLPPMARRDRKAEARLPFWSTMGKMEMLMAYIVLDQVTKMLDRSEWEAKLVQAVKHITLSLGYDELIADEYFDLVRAEGSLHRRILQDGLNIGELHQYAHRVAVEQALAEPSRFQQFLERMFGPAGLWQ